MKRILMIVASIMMAVTLIQAQESMFNKGDKVINLGIGIGNTLYTGSYYARGIPPVSFSYEQGIVDEVFDKGVIGILGYVGYTSYKYEYQSWGYKYSNILVGGGGLFHYPLVDKLDTYAGILLGYNISTSKRGNTFCRKY